MIVLFKHTTSHQQGWAGLNGEPPPHFSKVLSSQQLTIFADELSFKRTFVNFEVV